ncbi:MAG: LytTR family DNA-binding domain-containing protein [Raineya sp.]|jgi:two-component system LytT family response regulator|nr:LytTR family DNA-binding domain-containing protein [Raineya sp.]
MLKAIIIEDETKARRVLEELVKEYCPDVEILASVDSVPEGVKAIKKFEPNLVFLDIEMPQYNGFQLFDFIEDVNFEVIFTTAYQEYAIQAFEVSAIAYLLKPIQIEKLIQAIDKVKEKSSQQSKERIQVMKSALGQEKVSKVALPISEGFLFVELNDIMYLTAEGAYTTIILRDGRKFLVSRNIKSFEEIFHHSFFFRPHRSYLINLNAVKQFIRQDGGYILMENGDSVSISKEKKEDFLMAYQSLK